MTLPPIKLLRQRLPNLWRVFTVLPLCMFVSILLAQPSWCGPIYVFKQKDGSIRFTNKKPPSGVNAKVFELKKPLRIGSGWFTKSGEIVTNYHVIDGARSIWITIANGRRMSASVKRIDPINDLALLTPESTQGIPQGLAISAKTTGMGAAVFTIGYPLTDVLGNDAPKLTNGIVSAVGSKIQISVPIQPGNSGGALINQETGEVVGVVVSKLTRTGASEIVPEGVGFAVRVEHIQKLIGSRAASQSFSRQPRRRFPLEYFAEQSSKSVVLVETFD